ncbi:MAG: hypothetical protein IJ429_02010 [Lachnospiraceae bacterium]|nr:hypothetical protein [Lachnospiraceae bacterium]
MLKKYKNKIVTVMLYIVFCFILVFAISNKENYHVDEVFSYGLANHKSDGAASMKIKKGKVYENPLNPYNKYMTVNKKHRFDYKSVWENQKNDVHPPFYYAILHTISSLFPGRFSRWFAGIINIGFAVLTLFMIRKLILYLTEDKAVCLLLSVGFVLNSGIISSTTFFRMYVITMFWGCVLSYLFLRMLREGVSWKWLGLLYITTVLSALTHYYCIVFVALMSFVFGIFLLIKRMWKKLLGFCATMVLAAGTAILIFPSIIEHMFFDYRGEEAITNLQNSQDFWARIKSFFGFANNQLFGNQLGYLVLIILFAALYAYCIREDTASEKKKGEKDGGGIFQYVFLFVPVLIYFLLVSKIASFVSDRYLFPIYGVAFVLFLCCVNHLLSACFGRSQQIALLCVLLAFITYGSWKGIGWPYLYQGTDKALESLEQYSDTDCIFIYSERFQVQYKFREIACYDSVTFLKDDNLSKLPEYEEQCDELIVIINSRNTHADYLNEIMTKYPTLTQYKELNGVGEGKTYYCW